MNCPNCDKELKPIAAVLEGEAIKKILNHLGLGSYPPYIHPGRITAATLYCQS